MKTKYYYKASIIDGREQDKVLLYTEYINDKNQIVKTEIFEDNKIVQVQTNQYHDGKTVEEVTEYLQTKNTTRIIYKYENDLLISKLEYSDDDLSVSTLYSYNKSNQNISVIQSDKNNKIIHQIISNRNESTELVQHIDEENYIYFQEQIEVNHKGQPSEIVRSDFYFDTNNNEQEDIITLVLTYDDRENILSQEIYRDEKLIQNLSSKYNSKNMPTEEIDKNYLDNLECITTYKYNKEGKLIHEMKLENEKLLIEQKHFYSKGELMRTETKELIDEIYYETGITIEIE